MQSNQLVNFANEFDFMPDLALITISKVLWANAGGKQLGDAKEKAFPKSLSSLPLQNWALISSLDLIKLVNVPSAIVRVVGGRVDSPRSHGAGAAGPARGRLPPFTGRCHTCPELQACTLQSRRLEREGAEVGEGAPQALGGSKGSPGWTRRVPRPTPRTPFLDKRHSAVKGRLPR